MNLQASSTRITSLQAYHLGLFRNAVHPEFFRIDARSRIVHGEYEFEGWICRGAHALRFEHQGLCVTEIVSEELDQLPGRGLIIGVPCAGEKDHEAEVSERIGYMTSIQTETLSDHLYVGTYNEMLEHGHSGDCLMSLWTDEIGKPNLSLLDVQRYGDEVHAQGYHLRSDCGLVLRSQSIFIVKTP